MVAKGNGPRQQAHPSRYAPVVLALATLAALMVAPRHVGAAAGREYDRLQVSVRPPILAPITRLTIRPEGTASVIMEPVELSIFLTEKESLRFTTPRYKIPGAGTCELVSPALVLDAVCSNFSIELTNQLPFQPFHTCPAGGDGFENGPKDFEWTNLHTHGLKVNPGATDVSNICDPSNPDAGIADPTISVREYYCDDSVSSQQLCPVFGDNVLAIDRPITNATYGPYGVRQHPAGATLRYTYPLPSVAPGVGWYHGHQHGSVGIQVPTAAAPLIVPESSLPGGLWDLYTFNGGRNRRECERLVKLMSKMPLEQSTILQINGIWFRNTTVPDNTFPDDDSIPFLGIAPTTVADSTAPPSALLYTPEGDGTFRPLFSNPAGRDWALVNGAFQPTITVTASRFTRFQIINTMTMKWLDLTIQQVDAASGSLTPADTCKFWLLGRDGVPLPKLPRLLTSRPIGSARAYNDIIMGPANRVDVLLKCDAPGTFVLASGAGPFHTDRDACRATHCECFGDPPANDAVLRPANNLYDDFELDAAVLATLVVTPLPPQKKPQSDLTSEVCRSRLERFPYLNYHNFPRRTQQQCYSFMNQLFGGFCTVNNGLFPNVVAYVEQGTQQLWNIRDITFHPFHLHETPVRLTKLPPCVTGVTNNVKVGDWLDSVLLPTCQTGCSWTETGSGFGACGANVTVCDETSIQWLATDFSQTGQQHGLCSASNGGGNNRNRHSTPQPQPPAGDCSPRVSVFHCHILSHEDEGCMAVVLWYCPGFAPPASQFPGRCPTTYLPPNCQPPPPL